MIQKERHINSLYYIKHRKDKLKNTGFNYEKEIFNVTLSNLMLDNPTTKNFLDLLRKQVVWMIESTLVIRNFYNFTVDKYYNKHSN